MNDLIVIGASGFSGKRLCNILRQRDIPFDALVRETSDTGRVGMLADKLVRGDASDPDDLARALKGYHRCIHIPDLSAVRDAEAYIAVFKMAGLEKVVFVSSTNMFTALPAATKPVRQAAEAAIRNSGLNYVIIRPTMIYGGPDDINVSRLMKLIQKWPVLPVFNGGKALQQPVYVEDHAQALVDALLSNRTDRKAYNISGPSAMTYRSMMQQIAVAAGRKTKFVSVPVRPVCFTARMMEKLHRPFPFRSEQFLRLVENKNVDHTEAAADFAFSPRSFAEGLRAGYFAGKH